MIPSSSYARLIHRTGGLALWTAVLLAAAACVPSRTPELAGEAALHHPVPVSSGVAARPGVLAWSPDGTQLAFLDGTGTVGVVDAASSSLAVRRLDIPSPRSLAWACDGTLYALSREKDRDILLLVGDGHPGVTRVALDRRADAVYPVDRSRAFLLSIELAKLRIGTEVRCALFRLDLASGSTTTLHAYRRIFPTTEHEEDFLTAWAQAGLNRLDGTFLIMEHIKPPALPPYTLVQAFDPVSGDLADLGGPDRRTIYLSADWSPEGRRIALTTRDGRLVVRRTDTMASLEIPVPGIYPAWHPAGELLMVGGTLVDASTGRSVPLVGNDSGSYARWSPGGTRLALITQGELLLLTGFAPSAPSRTPLDLVLNKKLIMLQELLSDGLITAEDYRARRSQLLRDREGGR